MQFTGDPPWDSRPYAISLCKGKANVGVKAGMLSVLVQHAATKRRLGSLYRFLPFHVYIQGHFLHESIVQSEYTIFVSLCILELIYSEGNKNNKALKKCQASDSRITLYFLLGLNYI